MGNRRKAMHKAFSRWMNANKDSRWEEADEQLKHNTNLINELKERQR